MRGWIKLILALTAIAVLCWLVVRIGDFTLSVLSANRGEGGESDPMFAEELQTVTPPPELRDSQGEGVSRFQDNSENWDNSVQTPVDQTADELGRESTQEAAGT